MVLGGAAGISFSKNVLLMHVVQVVEGKKLFHAASDH
jgi:hypothetical protein